MPVKEGEELVATLQTNPTLNKGTDVLAKLASDGRWAVELTQVHDDETFHFRIIRLPQEEDD